MTGPVRSEGSDVTPYYQDNAVQIWHGDCREIVPTLGRFELVCADPPYGKVVDAAFDHEWTNRPAMLESCREWRDVMVEAMNPNATLYWFAWPSLSGRIEALIAERLNTLAHIVWIKPTPRAQKHCPELLRAPAAETERILMAEHYGADNMALGQSGYVRKCDEARGFVFEPLRAYLDGERERAGVTRSECDKALGNQMSGHYFSPVQWALPTADNYAKLQALFNSKGGEYLRKDYEDLRKEYEELRRYFDMRTGDQKTDVWRFSPCAEKLGHPTPKPIDIMQYIVRLSCRPGGTVLDPFCGGGTTLRAAKNLGRKAVGVDVDERACEIAARRMLQEVLPLAVPTACQPEAETASLFDGKGESQ